MEIILFGTIGVV